MPLPSNSDLLTLRDHCLSVIAQAKANKEWLIRTRGVAEILEHSPDTAAALLAGENYWNAVAKIGGDPLGEAGQKVLGTLRPKEMPGQEKPAPKRGRGRPRSRAALSAVTKYNLFWVYLLAITPCNAPDQLLHHLTRPRQDIQVRTFFSVIKPLIRFNMNAEQAVEHCAAAFGIGQRRVREIVAEVRGGNLVDEQFKALRAMIGD